MSEIRILPQDQVVRLVTQADPREFTVLLGAGASRSSGVPLASEMIVEWRQLAFHEQAAAGTDFNAWCEKQPWYKSEMEYSELFELLYPDERARQKYVEPKVEGAFPGWGYLYLANIIRSGHFNVVFTTNFDDLINEALTQYVSYNAVVCAADSDVATINVSTARAKIIKLHGDYLFKRLKNTVTDLEKLDPNMQNKFSQLAEQCGMLVLGYAGRDKSIMLVLDDLLHNKEEAFPTGIYWGVRDAAEVRPAILDKLAADYPRRVRLFECKDFDVFLARLHNGLRLSPPVSILEPVQTARASFERLTTLTNDLARENPTIKEHLAHLLDQLGGSITQASNTSTFDLFEAQIALGQRDYRTAEARILKYLENTPRDAQALTVLGSALSIQGEEEGLPELVDQAVSKWREALKIDPKWVPARYNLAQLYATKRQYREAITECEVLLPLVPKDLYLRRNLAQLYVASGRLQEALSMVDWVLERDPHRPEVRLMRGAVLEQLGMLTDAAAEAEQAVRYAPADAWTRMALATVWAKLGKHQEASVEYMQAIQLDPQNPNFRLQVAIFFSALNAPFQALPHLETAAKLAPDSAEIRGWLAQTYSMIGRSADAQREAEKAVQLNSRDSRILSTAGQVFATANRPLEAERYYHEAIQQNPTFVNAYAGLAQLYWFSGQAQQYQQIMQRLAQINPAAAQQAEQQIQMMAHRARASGPGAGQSGRTSGWLDWTKLFGG